MRLGIRHRLGNMQGAAANRFSGLLDLYPGAAAAYSLERLSADTTNVVRVRRSSDDAEQDFTAAEVSDGTLTTFTGAGDGFVRTWYDQSGNARHAEQATAASQPQIVSAGALVTGGIDFDGSDDFLTNSADIFAQNFSIFSVHKSDTEEQSGPTFSREYLIVVSRVAVYADTRTSIKRLANYAPDGTARFIDRLVKQSAGVQELISFLSNGTNMTGYLDGTSQGSVSSTAAPNSPNNGFRIGRQDAGLVYHDGLINALIVYASDQSANRAAIEASLAEIYGITLA